MHPARSPAAVALAALLFLAIPAQANHSAPTGLRVTGTTGTSVSLDWNDYVFPTGVSLGKYRVRLYNAAGTQIGQKDTPDKTSAYTYTGLTAGTTYRFAVAAVSGGGHATAFSAPVTATPGGTQAPTDSDGDGVSDANDDCPGTAAGRQVDANGCPIVTSPETELVNGDFDTGNLSQWGGRFTPFTLNTCLASVSPCSDITVATSPVKEGSHSARIRATTAEETGSQAGSSRSELWRSTDATGNTGFPVAEGRVLRSKWSIYIPTAMANTISNWKGGIVIQQQSSNCSGCGGVIELNGLLELHPGMRLEYDDGGSTDPSIEPFIWRSAQLAPDTWHDIAIRKKYSEAPNGGWLEIYLNRVQQRLCTNSACSSTTGRLVQRNLHPNATSYRLHAGAYYPDEADPTYVAGSTEGSGRLEYFLDDYRILSGGG
jgi:Polysaccharide lyase/Fibronectin type III domain